MTIYGQVVTGSDVRRAVEAHIKLWIPTYLAEVADQHGRARADMPIFRSYVPAVELDTLDAAGHLPSCVVVAPGLMDEPHMDGRGEYRARWAVATGAVVSGRDQDNTLELAELYAGALRTLMIQHPSLGGFASGVEWLGERYDDFGGPVDRRTIAAGSVQFGVDVEAVVESRAGPMTPPGDPMVEPDDWPTVESVTVDVERRT